MKCPQCNSEAHLVKGDVIYPHRRDLYALQFWSCAPCKSYVGCHKGTTTPMGSLAGPELRQARRKAHSTFDEVWQTGVKSRKDAYIWLSEKLGIKRKNCHIGSFDKAMCDRVVEICHAEDWSLNH